MNAPPIPNNDYSLELFQGPLLAPIHVVGVGGAYVASAEDTEGSAVNAASPAVRDPFSLDWFDYDLSAGFSLPGAFAGSGSDFDNRGGADPSGAGHFVDVNFGAMLQFGGLGVAVTGDLNQFSLSTTTSAKSGASSLAMQVGRWKALVAYGFFGGELAVGAGARVLTMQIRQSSGPTLLTMTGAAPEVGALYMPTGSQWRVGATLRGAVVGGIFGNDNVTTDQNGVRSVGEFTLPSRVVMPWELETGVAYQLGPRPVNPGWENPHDQEKWLRTRIAEDRAERLRERDDELAFIIDPAARTARSAAIDAQEGALRAEEDARFEIERKRLRDVRKARYDNWPREKILLLASMTMTGVSDRAVSVAGFLDQKVESVGHKLNVTPRLGMEGEPLRDRMLLRTGTYVEPSRYENGTARQHFTFGGDVRLFPLDFWGLLPNLKWKVTFMADLAPRYTNYGIGIGNWH